MVDDNLGPLILNHQLVAQTGEMIKSVTDQGNGIVPERGIVYSIYGITVQNIELTLDFDLNISDTGLLGWTFGVEFYVPRSSSVYIPMHGIHWPQALPIKWGHDQGAGVFNVLMQIVGAFVKG